MVNSNVVLGVVHVEARFHRLETKAVLAVTAGVDRTRNLLDGSAGACAFEVGGVVAAELEANRLNLVEVPAQGVVGDGDHLAALGGGRERNGGTGEESGSCEEFHGNGLRSRGLYLGGIGR